MKRILGPTLSLCFLLACGGAPPPPPVTPAPAPPPLAKTEPAPRVTPDAPFRQAAPPADGQVTFTTPKIATAKLSNGLRVFIVERHDLPIVSARLVLSLGAGDLEGARPGVLSFLGSMLERGTKKRSALQLSDDFEAIGAHHSEAVEWDSVGTSVRVLSDQLDPALDLLADVSLAPSFPNDEIERVRTQRLGKIQADKNVPATVAATATAAALFGRAHPYGHPLMGGEAETKAIGKAELMRAYERLFAVENAALVVVGDVSQATLLPKLEAKFGTWKSRPAAATRKAPKPPAHPDTDKRVVLVDRPGAQSQVQVVRLGVSHAVKDREAILVANTILGGMFSARINMNLRERNAYTYGARSHFTMLHGAGPFVISGAIMSDKTGPAIKEILSELDGLKKGGPTEEEMAMAKESIRLQMPAHFETTTAVANAIAELVVYDLPLDDYDKRLARVDAVTAADVKRVANEYFGSESMTVVVVGGKSTVLPQLEPLGLGPIDERDAYGFPLGAAPKAPPLPKKK